jgi:uncharacterized protein (UPF0248 family)
MGFKVKFKDKDKLNPKWKIIIFYIFLIFISNLFVLLFFLGNNLMLSFHDVDRRDNGNTFIAYSTIGELISHVPRQENQIPVEVNHSSHKIIEVNTYGEIVWEYIGVAYPHEIEELPNGNILIADTGYDRVIEINYTTKKIIWEWKPEYLNWTLVNPKWNQSHYYNNKITYDWSHLNDVDFKQYSTYNACLISIRNFDLVIELNYTAEIITPNNPTNIIWYYGDYNNHSLLFEQHNPDYLANGNIIIADSRNNRIIEINKTTKEVVWKYDSGLYWARDADEKGENILITDSANSRVIEISKNTKEIIWNFHLDLIIPYEADYLDNGNILISNGITGVSYEVNRNKEIVWRYGVSFEKSIIYMNFIFILSFQSIIIFILIGGIKSRKSSKLGKIIRLIIIGIIIFSMINIIIGFWTYNNTLGDILFYIVRDIFGAI